MKQSHINKTFIKFSQYIVAVILILLPFHALLSVWAGSNFGHYTFIRLWKEILIISILLPVLFYLFTNYSFNKFSKTSLLLYISLGYILISLIVSLIAYKSRDINLKAFGYGMDINLRYIFFFWLCLFLSKHSKWLRTNCMNILLIPGILVVVFGLAQHFILPADFLKHFGYSTLTIIPFQTVDSNNAYIRLQSTLRGANPLGVYLVLIMPGYLYKLIKSGHKARLLWGAMTISSLIVLFYSYSRSAYIGALISCSLVIWVLASKKLKKIFLIASAVLIALVIGLFIVLKNNTTFQDTVLHTSNTTKSQVSSNQKHQSSIISGLKDVASHPLGSGVGSAGPASVYNNHPSKIAENYYVQIAQETGIIGFGLLISILILIGVNLVKSIHNPMSLILFASLIGISFVNLLSHAWADDTISLLWFGLAGIALAPEVYGNSFKLKNQHK